MQETAPLELHIEIDRGYEQRRQELLSELSELDTKCRVDHEDLDRLWPKIKGGYAVSSSQPATTPTQATTETNGRRTFFPLQDTLKSLISTFEEGTETNQQALLAILLDKYPVLRGHKKESLRAQISQLLKKFSQPGGMLALVKESQSGNPAIYRKIKQESTEKEPAARTASPLLPVSEHKEDLPVR
jgi:hypothetical protein